MEFARKEGERCWSWGVPTFARQHSGAWVISLHKSSSVPVFHGQCFRNDDDEEEEEECCYLPALQLCLLGILLPSQPYPGHFRGGSERSPLWDLGMARASSEEEKDSEFQSGNPGSDSPGAAFRPSDISI